MGYGNRFQESWPNDHPFTTTTTVTPLTVQPEKVTPTQTAMLEVFQWLYSSTVKPFVSTMSTWAPSSTSGSFVPSRDEWGNSIETYRVDEPPHWPGLSRVSFWTVLLFPAIAHFVCGCYFHPIRLFRSRFNFATLILCISIIFAVCVACLLDEVLHCY